MSCQFECLATYACSSPILPPTGAVYAPYVIVGFLGNNGEYISVGNQSSPDSHAVVKSFEYGFSEGAGAKIEIIDEKGSSLSTFVQRLNKTVCNTNNDYKLFVDFGWIIKSCDGNVKVDLASMYGNKFYFLPIKIDMAYEGSKIKYTIEGADLQDRIAENRVEENQGTEDNKKPLKQAITDLFAETCPPIENVKFEKADGTPWFFKNSDGGANGPKAVWTSDQQNSLATTRKWLDRLTTKDGKGVIFQWKPDEETPTLVLLEDPNSGPNENNFDCARNIGTYIVNGGNCLDGYTTVLTEDGWERINNLYKFKYSGRVKCLDKNKNLIWSKVTNWYRSLKGNRKLFKVNLKGSRKHYKNTSGGIFTEDHEILTLNGYKEIGKLTPNIDKINTGQLCPSGFAYEALIGTLLGDSYFTAKSNKFECCHCFEQSEYLEHKAELFSGKIVKKKNSLSMSVPANNFYRNLAKIFYPNKEKIIPKEILKNFTLISLAYLYMDDGSFDYKYKKRAEIAVCSFKDDEVDALVERIKLLGIDCARKKYGNYNRIKFSRSNSIKLIELIKQYVHPIFDYKLGFVNRDINLVKQQSDLYYDDFNLIEMQKEVKYVYCIEVENYNNFLTHSGIVHNCSSVLGFTPQIAWTLADSSGAGGSAGPADGGGIKAVGPEGSKIEKVGTQTGFPVPQNENMWRPPSSILEKGQEAGAAHAQATRWREVPSSIEAELKIIGDPKLAYPLGIGNIGLIMKTVSIIAINPFYVIGKGGCEWLADPPCNEILSNRNWMIMGANHQIKEGSYITTLKLRLAVPNVDLEPGSKLGGTGTVGFTNDVSEKTILERN